MNGSGGNDDWDGQSDIYNSTTGSGPKLSIKNATGTVNSNGTVHISDGVYSGANNTGITIDKNMNIMGQSQTGTVIDGSNTEQIFNIQSVNFTIQNLTLTNGNENFGGAIYNAGNLTITNTTLRNNTANYYGGAIFNSGNLTISNTTLSNNTAANYFGGAIYNHSNLTITNTILSNNTANNYGGAIYNHGTLIVNFSRIVGNTANQGSAIYNDGTVDAEKNWWGSNADPKTISNLIIVDSGSVNTDTWVILTVHATPNTINNGQTTTITADLNHVNGNDPLTGGHIPDGPITFNSTLGSLNPVNTITSNGEATTTFTPTCYSGIGTVNVTVDGFNLGTPIIVTNTEIYVSNNTGNDITGDGSQINPYQTILKGINLLSTGGNLHIADAVYSGVNNTGITISKNMNIMGQSQAGTVINGSNTAQIFYILSGVNVTIQDLTITNGNATSGGAICNYYGSLSIFNSTICNNAATYYGGAIYNSGGSLSIFNSTLNNNTATYYGGAIYNYGSLSIFNSTLCNNNAATYYGGAIYNYGGSLSISNSTLCNNTANFGGAIVNNVGTFTITNSSLNSNVANSYGGAMFNHGGTLIVNFSRIVGNTANQGSAIYNDGNVDAEKNWWGSNADPKTISNLIVMDGGSVNTDTWVILSVNATPNTIITSQTTNITADFNHINGGGDLIGGHIPDGIPVTFSSTFGSLDPVSVFTSNGQAKSVFTANAYSGMGTVNAMVDGFSLGTPVTVTNAEIYVSNNTGSDVTGDGSSGNPYQSILKGINWVSSGGNIHIADGVYSGVNNTGITVSKSMNIMGQSQAGTVIDGSNMAQIFYILSGINVTIQDLTITNGHASNGAAIYNDAGNLTITNSAFNHNTAYNGGAIINYYGNLTIANSTFSNNTANYGGSIYNCYGGTLIINNITLNNNTADYGGSIYNMGTSTIANSTFYGNTANNNGGAIYNDYGTSNISNTTLNYNRASYAGGAIYTYYNGILTIANSTLYSNTANIGGAMCIFGTLTANFNRIVGNIANQGSAIYNSGGTVNAEKNWWGSNTDPKTIPNLIYVNSGSLNIPTWVILSVNATPNTINAGQTANITADFNHINGGGDLTGGHIPEGTVDFTTDWGSLNQSSVATVDGEARTTFQANGTTSPSTNPVKVYAAADSEINTYAPVTIVMPTKLVLNEAMAYKGKTIKLTATLWDTYYNQAISGQSVTFKINGKVVGSANTNANGVATLAYKDLTGKSSTITGEFAGSSQYVSSNSTNQLIGEKTFTLTVKNTGKSRIHLVYYVTVYKPNNAKPIFKKYNFYLNPGKTKKINIGTYPIGTAVSSDQFIYNTQYTKQKVSLSNTWTAQGLKVYTQKFAVKNVPGKQKRAVYAKNRFWINKNALNTLIVKKPRIK